MPQPPNSRKNATLIQPSDEQQHEVMRQWQRMQSGMDGERGRLPETPDDAVAYKLLDAAGDAIGRGELRTGLAILRLIVKERPKCQEAACARTVLDRLAAKGNSRC